MRWTTYAIPMVVVTGVAGVTWTQLQLQRASFNELQPVFFELNQAANENNWHQTSPTVTVSLVHGAPTVQYALVPEGTTPKDSDYQSVTPQTSGYQAQYRYRYITRTFTHQADSPGADWVKTGATSKETYWAAVRTETGLVPSDLPKGTDRFYSVDDKGNHTNLTWREQDVPSTSIPDTYIYRYEVDGFYHTAPAYYANGQPVPVVWQGKYTKPTKPTTLYYDSWIKVDWNTGRDQNQILYKYDQVWEAIPLDGYYPLLLGFEQNAHIPSWENRDGNEWSKNFQALADKNKDVRIVGVDFKKITYQRAQRTLYEWKKETDSGYIYTNNLAESTTQPTGTIHHEQATTIKQFEVTVPLNGRYKLYVKQSDGLGNTSVETSQVIQTDNQLPQFTYTLDAKGQLTYQASDSLSGIQWVKLPNGTLAQPSSNGNSSLSGTYLFSKEGVYAFEVLDLAGNRKTYTVTYEKDVQAPTGTHQLSPSVWTNQSVNLTLTVKDTSGIESILLPNNQLVLNTEVIQYAINQNGNYPFLVTDKAGNTLSYVVVVSNIDQEKPVAQLNPSITGWTNQPIQFQISASDRHSGIQSVHYQSEGGSWVSSTTTGRFTHTAEGVFKYRVQATDQAGNSYTSGYQTVQMDLTKPNATHTLSRTTISNQPVTITVTGTDALSQVKEIQKPDGLKTTGNLATYTASQNGTYLFRIMDEAGNVLDYPVTISNIDTGAPELNLSVANAEEWARSKTIQVTASDPQGISWIKLPNGNYVYASSTSYSVTENNYYYFETSDTVGNVTKKYLYVGKIDPNAPQLELQHSMSNFWTNEEAEVMLHVTD